MHNHDPASGSLWTFLMALGTFLLSIGHALQSGVATMLAIGTLCAGISSLATFGFRLYLYRRHGVIPGKDRHE